MATVSVVAVVHNQLALTRACLESLRPTTVPFDVCLIDNGSTDGTEAFFSGGGPGAALPFPVDYCRNRVNAGLIKALNQGAARARGDYVCFLHNDTEMREPSWLARLIGAVTRDRDGGLGGLYGAQRLRRD